MTNGLIGQRKSQSETGKPKEQGELRRRLRRKIQLRQNILGKIPPKI